MPTLMYSINIDNSPLELAAQALTVLRVQDYARQKGLTFEETQGQSQQRRFLLTIPLDELNSVLDELLFAGLLLPLQEISGRPSAHTILHERFSTMTWIDELE